MVMKIQEEKKVVRFKKPILVCTVLLGAAMGLQATPVCPTATGSSYATLEALGSCTIGDKTFTDFSYISGATGGATAVSASNLLYSVVDMGTAAIGFNFSPLGLDASSGQTNDILLQYAVTGPDITSAHDTVVGSVLGTGTATIGETVCPGNVIPACTSSISLPTVFIPGPPTSASAHFGAVTLLGIFKDVHVTGGTSGFANISGFANTVDQSAVPEPGFYGVLAGGLGAVLMFARRRKKTFKA